MGDADQIDGSAALSAADQENVATALGDVGILIFALACLARSDYDVQLSNDISTYYDT